MTFHQQLYDVFLRFIKALYLYYLYFLFTIACEFNFLKFIFFNFNLPINSYTPNFGT